MNSSVVSVARTGSFIHVYCPQGLDLLMGLPNAITIADTILDLTENNGVSDTLEMGPDGYPSSVRIEVRDTAMLLVSNIGQVVVFQPDTAFQLALGLRGVAELSEEHMDAANEAALAEITGA